MQANNNQQVTSLKNQQIKNALNVFKQQTSKIVGKYHNQINSFELQNTRKKLMNESKA